ncbi:serine--tRNA ligase [Desulfoferrobacter suflitae]|uniref:serine--tRNA ligase n=1 Tax=Desulfoferrobacter suflitae TaxID=2865782 RepID=UPI002164E1E8|nr:serine--tRNA ligase [Desulfoferrobacter suflitae]MCK8602704.1 serine--tRNA ligase [Desulfoferrobacter suflitae]
MLDLKYVRDHMDQVQQMLRNRKLDMDLTRLVRLDANRRRILVEVEELKRQRNVASEEISLAKREKRDASRLIEDMKDVAQRIKAMDQELAVIEERMNDELLLIPNMPHESVVVGGDEKDNPVIKTWGSPPAFDFAPRNHWDIGESLGILDFERAAKMTGARFALYWGQGAALERALINFMLDVHVRQHGYTEVLPPFMVNSSSLVGTGQLPKFKEDLFKLEGRDYYLIPTAEVPVTNIHMNEVLEEEDLPKYYTAYTPCFRSEAGSYGKDTRGLIRQHQFNKVELVKIVSPDTSYQELENLLLNAETILQKLNIHYRVVSLCTGDLGFSSAKTYDIEVWLPGQNTYREISSCSNFEDFQARRANIRLRRKGKSKTELAHTINGSGLAVGRTLVAVLENFQQQDGSVLIPPVLQPYLGNVERIETIH